MITENVGYALLAFVPALLNTCLIFYIFYFLPKSRTTDIFTCFVFALVLWQTEDTILRLCTSAETARFWDSIFCIGWLGMAPLAFHFACRYAGLKKLYSRLSLFLIYGPFVLFEVIYVANNKHTAYYWRDNWGWMDHPPAGSMAEIQRYWMSVMILGSVIILVRHALRIRKNKERKLQAWLIAMGIFLPSFQGIITQVIFPLLTPIEEIPVTSTFMTFFSLATIYALSKFKSLNVAESIQSDTLIENLNKLIFIVSPEQKIIYSNRLAAGLLGIKQEADEIIPFETIFPSGEELKKYTSEVFEKVLQGEKNDNFSSMFIGRDGQTMDVLVTSRLVVNNGVVQGVLIVANDITEKVRILRELEEERLKKEKEITDAVLVAQEKERKNIGSELHDNVNQLLGASLLYISSIKRESAAPHPYLDEIDTLVNNAVTEIRKLSHALIAPSLNETELTEALDKIIDTAGKTGTLNIEKDLGSFDENNLPEKLKLNIYRIVQEQFNNILKYAKANTIQLKLVQEGEKLILKIKDDGVGFDTSVKSIGVGLTNMQTRASLHNGKMKIVSSPGKGCELTVLFENTRA
jgi:PAS domain S-box-containing protein